jgi:hypothetical protein
MPEFVKSSGNTSMERTLGRVFFLIFLSLVTLFSFNLISPGQEIWITSFVVADLFLLIASLIGLVSSYLWLRGRNGWSRWGVVSLLGLAIGFSVISFNMVGTEGLFVSTLSPHFPWIGLCEQAGFLCWAGFALSFFWWNRPVVRRAGLILSLVFLALMAQCLTIWVFNVSWTVPTSSPYSLTIQETMRPAARATLYLLYLFIAMVLLRGASILSRGDREELSSLILYLGSLAPAMFLLLWLSLQWFDPFIHRIYDLGWWFSWIPAVICGASIISSLKLHHIEGLRLKLFSVVFVASWLSILQMTFFILLNPDPYTMLFRYWFPPRGTYGVYLFLVIMSFNSIIAARLIIRNLGKLNIAPRANPPVDMVLNEYSIGFALVLSALVLFSAPLIILDSVLESSSNIARFILLGTIMPALVSLIGCLVAWRNIGTIVSRPDQ